MSSRSRGVFARVTAPIVLAGVSVALFLVSFAIWRGIARLLDALGVVPEGWFHRAVLISVVLVPLLLSFWLSRDASAWLYAREVIHRPTILHHLWHCAGLYATLGWDAYSIISCGTTTDPAGASHCDALGPAIAVGFVALGCIAADAAVARQRRRVRADGVNASATRSSSLL